MNLYLFVYCVRYYIPFYAVSLNFCTFSCSRAFQPMCNPLYRWRSTQTSCSGRSTACTSAATPRRAGGSVTKNTCSVLMYACACSDCSLQSSTARNLHKKKQRAVFFFLVRCFIHLSLFFFCFDQVYDAIAAGCVPIIISDGTNLPFHTTLDWPSFSIQVCMCARMCCVCVLFFVHPERR